MKTRTFSIKLAAILAALTLAFGAFALTGCSPSQAEVPEKGESVTLDLNNPDSDSDEAATEEGTEATPEAAETAEATASEPSGTSTSNGGAKASGGSTGGSTSSKQSAPAATGSTPSAPSASSAPSHTHNWVAQYGTRTVTDKAAYDEPVYGIVCSCGVKSPGRDHVMATGHSTRNGIVDNIHHDAVTHTEQYVTGYTCSCGATK